MMKLSAKSKEEKNLMSFKQWVKTKPAWISGILFIITLVIALAGCKRPPNLQEGMPSDTKNSWKLVKTGKKDSADWQVYSRKVEGSSFKAFKITGQIDVSPGKAVEALRYKTEHSEEFYTEEEGFSKILKSTPDEALIYSVFRLPFPFRDRSMCERFLFFENKETGVHKITWQEDWSAAPPENKNIVRMPVARGSWEFVPDGNGGSRATYMVHAEPGGIIPSWMVNATVSKGLPAELTNIEEIAGSLK